MRRLFKVMTEKIVLVVTVLAVFMGSVLTTYASEMTDNGIDQSSGSIRLNIPKDKQDWYIDNSSFHIYKVASLNDDMTFSYEKPFQSAGTDISIASLNSYSAGQWQDIAKSFQKIVTENNLSDNGVQYMHNMSCTFSDLKLGLYLITGDTATEGNRTVEYQPVVICVPQRENAADQWQYDIEADVKLADPTYASPTPEPSSPSAPTPAAPVPENGNAAKTNDSFHVWFYGIVFTADVAVIVLFLIYRHLRSKGTEE